MSASPKQLQYIRDMINHGAPHEGHPSFDRPICVDTELHLIITSVEDADKFIKKNYSYLSGAPALGKWHEKNGQNLTPDMLGVYNH